MKRLAMGLGVAAAAAAIIRTLRRHHGSSEDVVRAYFDAWEDGDGDAIRDLVTDDFQAHVQTLGETEERGADELVSAIGTHAEVFSDVEYELHDVLAHNGCVAVRATMHARHEETGQEGEMDGIAILRLDGDRIAEEWSSWDYHGLANRLGLAESA
jgi:ketosteroid isomerase-like protein